MTATEIFNAIYNKQILNVRKHLDCAVIYDFCALRGLTRLNEYKAIEELSMARGIARYMINNIDAAPYMVQDSSNSVATIIPTSLKNSKRSLITKSDRKELLSKYLNMWITWECETLKFLEDSFKHLTNMGCVSHANKVNELVEEVRKELKYAKRLLLDYQSVDFDMGYVQMDQHKMHDHYENKMKEDLHITMC